MKFKGITSSHWSLKWHKLDIWSKNLTGFWLFRLYYACVCHIEEPLTLIWVGFLDIRFEEGVNRHKHKSDDCFVCLFIILKLCNGTYVVVVGRAYSEPNQASKKIWNSFTKAPPLEQVRALQTSKMVLLAKIFSNVNLKMSNILAKRFILDAWQSPGRASADWYITVFKI